MPVLFSGWLIVALAVATLLSGRVVEAGWWDPPNVCLVNTITSDGMSLSNLGPSAMDRMMVSGFRGANNGCPLAAHETLKTEVKEQLTDWALGLRPELRIQSAPSKSDSKGAVSSSFWLRASSKRILLGLGVEW